jgi:hypothetical protein
MTDNDEIESLLMNIDNINLDDIIGVEEEPKSTTASKDNKKTESTDDKHTYLGTEISEEHKIVAQLDEVTKESEEKATELFDIMNDMSSDIMWVMERFESMKTQIDVLREKNIEGTEEVFQILDDDIMEVETLLMHANNIVFEGMSLMQYQDISRQKIERVVNVLRSLIKYLNLLFEGKTEDTERTSSAAHLVGDNTADLMGNNDDLEDLINSFK